MSSKMILGITETDDITADERAAIKRWDALFALSPDDEQFAFKQFTEGKTIVETRIALMEQTKRQADDSGPVGFWDIVKQLMKEKNCGEGDAIRFCVGEYPELHQEFLAEQRTKAEAEKAQRTQAAEHTIQKPNANENSKPMNWDMAVKQRMKEASCSEGDAIRFCAGEYPDLHEKFLEE